jgi:hypothetical protein
MDQYEIYTLADRYFYDTPSNRGGERPDFAACTRPVPEGWAHEPTDVWMHYAPKDDKVPTQGWKIHVSACLEDAERVLDIVWDYCVAHGLAFKFLRNTPVLLMFNSKSAFRGSSGKLMTIYPVDEAQLELTLKELDGLLTGVRGPYILSDLRYGAGPLFVRYGGFIERHCLSETGERVLALENDEGVLVPDVRGPVFATPPWIALPAFLEPHLAARNAVRVDDLAYAIESVIQFSNGGGVYLGRHKETGRQVVLKEGRPFAGLDALERDAVTRIRHERDILDRLAGLDVVPEVLDYLELGDHHFLVLEFVDSGPLQRRLVNRYPLTHPDVSAEELAEFADWALSMHAGVGRAVQQLHDRGVVFCDLHPDNVLITESGRMVLTDFEVATLAEDKARSALAHPAYAAPSDRQGVDVDHYALACICLGLFAPQTTTLLRLYPGKARHLADLIVETFPVPRATIDEAVRTILGDEPDPGTELADLPMPGQAEWTDLRDAIGRAITASATPDRDDRLFPGDIAQFQPDGGISLAYGAAGVLYALDRTGIERPEQYDEWLLKRALDPVARTGFYDGRHGVGYVLNELGHRQEALDALGLALEQPTDDLDLGLHSGLSGIGLNLMHFAAVTGDPEFAERAARIVDITADRLGGPDDVPEISGFNGNPRAGLMYGSSGPALLFLHAYERSGDSGLLDLAETALRQDLRRCKETVDGMLQVNQDWRTLPYLDEGSVGIALALDRYLSHRDDPELAEKLTALDLVKRCRFYVLSGLFMGCAGIVLGAASLNRSADGPDEATTALLRNLRWHAMPYGGGLAFPCNQLQRLSMDLATGSAGVLLALGAALHPAPQERPIQLPFLSKQPPGAGRSDDPDYLRKEV